MITLTENAVAPRLVDASSQPHLVGMTVDFVTDLESASFVFHNPNARDAPAASPSASRGKSLPGPGTPWEVA